MANQIILGSVNLPVDLQWFDEFKWSSVDESEQRTLTGALVVDQAPKLAGRPITLVGRFDGGKGYALITRATVLDLLALEDPPGTVYPLTLADDRNFNVMLRNDGPAAPAIEATPMKHIAPVEAGDLYSITIRLREVNGA